MPVSTYDLSMWRVCKTTCLHVLDSILELLDCASYHDDVCSFFGKLASDSFAHALRATGDDNSL